MLIISCKYQSLCCNCMFFMLSTGIYQLLIPRRRQIFPTALRAGMEEGLIDKIVSDK